MLTVVTGPPCSGKSTYVAEHRDAVDLVVDVDALAHALGYPDDHLDWDSDHPARAAARAARRAVTDQLDPTVHTWIVDTSPHPTSVRIWQRAGARFVDLDPGRAVCHDRATTSGRTAATHEQIDRWYAARPAASAALGVFG